MQVMWFGDQSTSWLPLGQIFTWASRLVLRSLRFVAQRDNPVLLNRYRVAIQMAQDIAHGTGEMVVQDTDRDIVFFNRLK